MSRRVVAAAIGAAILVGASSVAVVALTAAGGPALAPRARRSAHRLPASVRPVARVLITMEDANRDHDLGALCRSV